MTQNILSQPKKIVALLISFYQTTFSPDHGLFRARFPYGFCRYYPSCSQYAKEAVLKYGISKGLWLGIKRIFKCNPWSEPRVDLI